MMSISSRKQPGFTLLELIFVIIIIGLLSAVALPTLRWLTGDKRAEFVNQLSQLVQVTWQNAVVTGQVHRINFDSAQREIRAEIRDNRSANNHASSSSNSGKSSAYKLVAGAQFKAQIPWDPELFAIKDWYLTSHKSELNPQIQFLIFPEGLTQPVILNFEIPNDQPLSLVLNPFSAQFKLYDSYQTPTSPS